MRSFTHRTIVPARDMAPQALHPGLVQKDSVQTRNTDGVWSAIIHCCSAVMRETCQTAEAVYRHALRWLSARSPYPFCKKNRRFSIELEARLALRKQQRADRIETARKRNITGQQNEALRRRAHRHDMLAAMGK